MSMANFIATRRKEKGMTQKQLAGHLGVTDKAVSKWERGNGQPDIGYLQPLADALGVTVSELLKGETENAENKPYDKEKDETVVENALGRAHGMDRTKNRNIPRMAMLSFLALGLAAIITTSIVDFALNGRFTWSLLPISAILFSWVCITPLLSFKKRGVDISLLATSIFIFPFLSILCTLTGGRWFASVAVPMSISGIIILWLIRAVLATKLNIWNKLAVSILVGAAGSIIIAFILGSLLPGGGFDIWNLMSVAILVVIALILFAIGRARKNNNAV